MIVSASRRTDIPAFYSDWFFRRLKEGFALTRNPFNPSQEKRVSLLPQDVDCFVFWTKDPSPMLERLPELGEAGYPYYFQFSLTPYGKSIERNLRPKEDIIAVFQNLSTRLGGHRVLWRYDPVILNDDLTVSYHIKQFSRLCDSLAGYAENVTISFVDLYYKVKTNQIREISREEMQILAGEFSLIAAKHGILVRSCCEDLQEFGINPAACVDSSIIERVAGKSLPVKRDKSQRKGCNCAQSVDIGVYNTCGNGCVYCYANHSPESIKRNMARHDPASPFLFSQNNKLPQK